MNPYLIKYLKDHCEDPLLEKVYEYSKMNLDWYLYNYGKQTNHDFESKLSHLYDTPKEPWMTRIHKMKLKSRLIKMIQRVFAGTKLSEQKNNKASIKVLSLLPFSSVIDKEFELYGIEIVSLEQFREKNPYLKKIEKWYADLDKFPFNERIKKEHYEELENYFEWCKNEMSEYKAIFVPTGAWFLERFLIDVFRSEGKKSYCFLHGLPGSYEVGFNFYADYLLVWGEKIKDNFVAVGADPQRIIVSGSVNHVSIPESVNLCSNLEDVLVLTTVYMSSQYEGWDGEKFSKPDRSSLLLYIYSVENVLKQFGVTHARLRPHPVSNIHWLEKFIDTEFYEIDTESLSKSLSHTSLAIGPISSTCLESLLNGVNYIVYHPDFGRNSLVPPFDGSDTRIKVSQEEKDLVEMIRLNEKPDISLFKDYIIPFSVAKIPL